MPVAVCTQLARWRATTFTHMPMADGLGEYSCASASASYGSTPLALCTPLALRPADAPEVLLLLPPPPAAAAAADPSNRPLPVANAPLFCRAARVSRMLVLATCRAAVLGRGLAGVPEPLAGRWGMRDVDGVRLCGTGEGRGIGQEKLEGGTI